MKNSLKNQSFAAVLTYVKANVAGFVFAGQTKEALLDLIPEDAGTDSSEAPVEKGSDLFVAEIKAQFAAFKENQPELPVADYVTTTEVEAIFEKYEADYSRALLMEKYEGVVDGETGKKPAKKAKLTKPAKVAAEKAPKAEKPAKAEKAAKPAKAEKPAKEEGEATETAEPKTRGREATVVEVTPEMQAIVDGEGVSKSRKFEQLYALEMPTAQIAKVFGSHYSFVYGVIERYKAKQIVAAQTPTVNPAPVAEATPTQSEEAVVEA